MKEFKIISWSRDSKGKTMKRPLADICNAVTTFIGGDYKQRRELLQYDTICISEIYNATAKLLRT